ncbi:Carbonic anhydrase-related protein [Chelonia mydas]|uniref:Carbonic anhydrase-related protein n=1 Tax=Chelonia mydas TaxID=8469 RepID=M7BDQ4_CHEMY|nr:Carbonic anhydrase-related protein [Chelonia mydas]
MADKSFIEKPESFPQKEEALEWGYEEGVEWGLIFPDANGEYQSPINLNSREAKYDPSLLEVRLSPNYVVCRDCEVINDGHSIQIVLKSKSVLVGGPLPRGHEFELHDVQFHWGRENQRGSEHTVNFKAFPMELGDRRRLGYVSSQQQPGGVSCLSTLCGQEGTSCFQPQGSETERRDELCEDPVQVIPSPLLPLRLEAAPVPSLWHSAERLLLDTSCLKDKKINNKNPTMQYSEVKVNWYGPVRHTGKSQYTVPDRTGFPGRDLKGQGSSCCGEPRASATGAPAGIFLFLPNRAADALESHAHLRIFCAGYCNSSSEAPLLPVQRILLHLIHWNSTRYSSIDEAVGKKHGIAIIALFVQIGKEHLGLKVVTEILQDIQYKGKSKTIPCFNPNSLLPDPLLRDYWVYEGSLTIPPCSENVTWILFRYPLTVSQLQIEEFRRLRTHVKGAELLEGCDGILGDNFRPTQPLSDRVIKAAFQ